MMGMQISPLGLPLRLACLLVQLVCLPLAPSASAQAVSPCTSGPFLNLINPLDFGDLGLSGTVPGFLTIDPRGAFSGAINVIVKRAPRPGEFWLCGPPNSDFEIVIPQPTIDLMGSTHQPAARRIRDVTIEADGVHLIREAPGIWRGSLGASGRASIFIGATLDLQPANAFGRAEAQLQIEVFPR